jgi:hypothetical protein
MSRLPFLPLAAGALALSAVLSIVLKFYISSAFALGTFLTTLWSAAWLLSTAGLLRHAAVPKGAPKNEKAILFWAVLKMTVYGIAIWVLFSRPLPALSHAVGFTVMMVVLAVGGARHGAPRSPAQPRQDDDAQDP